MIPLSFFLLPRTLCDSLYRVLQLSHQLRPLSHLALVLGAYLLQIFRVRFQDLLAGTVGVYTPKDYTLQLFFGGRILLWGIMRFGV